MTDLRARIPVVVSAKNEERAIGRTLEALVRAIDHAEVERELTFDLRVVLDDTTDGTEAVARRFSRVQIVRSSGGKVEAQRAGLVAAAPVTELAIFCDADVLVSEDALVAMCDVLATRPDAQVATCPLTPLPPRRATLLASALHTYNRRRGFSSQRTWFNGKLFAMRRWQVPSTHELGARIAALPRDPFYDFEKGLAIDDIYLSRRIVAEHGPGAIVEASRGEVRFRAPETLRGMNRYYRRMRRELERLDRLFPETVPSQRAHGRRRQDLRAAASPREKLHAHVFDAALLLCRAAYVVERAWVRHVRRAPRPWWTPVEETKVW